MYFFILLIKVKLKKYANYKSIMQKKTIIKKENK